ncbi:MAG: S8 family serine peptidase [Burkholderiales bacterium]|nr:S8 family serine peptidase [Burkholderiales bacterium]
MKLRPISLAAMLLLSGFSASTYAQEARRPYIVQLQAQPTASYAGGVANLAPTQATSGSRINFESVDVQNYVRYLGDQQNLVTSTIANAEILASYNTVLNGFAAMLTDAEVQSLQNNPNVLSVQANEMRQLQTITTTSFLGLDAANGMWSQLGGRNMSGEGMVVGIIDGGIWPENTAFADRVDANGVPTHDAGGTQVFGPAPATYKGACDSGLGFDPAKHCNNKLVGAHAYASGMKASNPTFHWTEFLDSPRDSVGGTVGHGGHGDHTASTVAGNWGATAVISGVPMGIATGMAPRARIAAYKVCWTFVDATATDGTGSKNSCTSIDIVSAIDQAVKDGVNVINFSISGGESVNDLAEQAFLRAANAGVFVAASAGNSGPDNQVAHISPWLTTVAASTHDRSLKSSVTLGNGAKYSGASFNTVDLAASPMIRAEDAGLAGADATELKLCFSNSVVSPGTPLLDPAKVAGKVVTCTRGTNARVDKSLAVLNAGGAGMVLVDNGAGLVAEVHSVPTVHVSAADGALIKTYATTASANAAISKFGVVKVPAPIMAGFSSRGPNRFDGNQLKPDITGPGVDIIANVTPGMTEAERNAIADGSAAGAPAWASYQGTSMSSPHIAGIATLLRQQHPTWSPAAVKSAMMTTSTPTLDDGLIGMQNGKLPWSQGAGHVNPNGAANPGLVYDLGKNDYIKYQCKVNKAAVVPASDCTTIGTLNETYNLNLPSLTVGNVVGPTTMTREVTNVSDTAATYNAVASLPGFNVLVTPSTLNLAAGAKAAFTVKITPVTAVENVWAYGALTWSDAAGHVVRSPLSALVGKAVSAPAELTSDKVSGSKLFAIKTGFTGAMGTAKGGLKAATLGDSVTLAPGALTSAQLKAVCVAGSDTASTKVHNFAIPANTVAARFSLRNQDTSNPGADDFDMMLLKPDGSYVYSGNDGSAEQVQIASPAAGNYKVCVTAYGTATGNPDMSYHMSNWVVTTGDTGGNFSLAAPSKVVSGANATVGMSWSGLATNQRYLAAGQFKDAGGNVQATTILRIETGAVAPTAVGERSDTRISK